MRIFIYILILIATGLIIFNATKVDTAAAFEGDSLTALITIMLLACAIVILLILSVSRRIEKKIKGKK